MPLSLNQIKKRADELNCSEEFKKEILSYAKNLLDQRLPVIFSLYDFAGKIDLYIGLINSVLKSPNSHYKFYKLRKKKGGYRWINSPDELLKGIQFWIYKFILRKVTSHESSFGFVPGKSIADNTFPHTNQEVILNIDLYRFFDTITQRRVFGVFKWLGYHPNLAYSFAQLLTVQQNYGYWKEIENEAVFSSDFLSARPHCLPQGSPASPAIANIVCYRMDIRFKKLADSIGCNYTRYADDITFSGDSKNIPSINTIRKIIKDEGFYINENKIKYTRQNNRQEVTGLVVNNGVRVKRKYKQKVRTELYHCLKHGPEDHLAWLRKNKGLEEKSNYRDYLLGKICFIYSVEPKVGKEYLEMYNQINWEL